MRGPEFYYTSIIVGGIFSFILLLLFLADALLKGGF